MLQRPHFLTANAPMTSSAPGRFSTTNGWPRRPVSCSLENRAELSPLLLGVVHAVDALPDARFVGFAETVNDFEIKSGELALTRSSNELVRGYATRAVAEHT